MVQNFIILGLLVFLSAFFSSSETAIFSLTQAKIDSLVKAKRKNSKLLAKLKSKPQRLLINILIGNNLVNIGASILSAMIALEIFGSSGPAIATGILTIIILIFGEIGPKTFASSRAENFALTVTPMISVINVIFRPLAIIFENINKLAVKMFAKGGQAATVSIEELKAMAEIGAKEGVVKHKEKEMIRGVLELNDITACDIMTVKQSVFALPSSLTIKQALPQIAKDRFSRIPIFKDSIDNIEGVVLVQNILKEIAKGKKSTTLKSIANKPYFVPKQRKIDSIFKDFQRQHNHIAIVLDEQGETVGIVTLEDLLEEIVGEIMDESDINEYLIKRINKYTILVDAGTEAREAEDFLNIDIPGKPQRLISEVFLEKFGKIPNIEDKVEFENFDMIIKDATKKKIKKIKIVKHH